MTVTAQHSFKVGDEVFIDRNRYGSKKPFQLAKVERVTKTQFTAAGSNWKPYGGNDADRALEVGGNIWDRPTAMIATPERHAENQFRIAARDSEAALYKIANQLHKLKDQDAIDAYAAMPQAIKELAQ